jgi:hypothetical protein
MIMEAQLAISQSNKKDYLRRYVGVVFGNPRLAECSGYGICKMEDEGFEPPQKKARGYCPRYIATIERLEKEGSIYLFLNFLKSTLNTDIIKRYFSKTQFIMGSTLLLPLTISEAFEMPPLIVTAGLYPIIETTTYFRLLIQKN